MEHARISRVRATITSLVFQYASVASLILRGLIVPPIAISFIDAELLGAWFASGNVIQLLMMSEGGAWLYLRQQVALHWGRLDGDSVGRVLASGAAIIFGLAVAIALLGTAVNIYLPQVLNLPDSAHDEFSLAFLLAVAGMALGLPASIPRALSHGLQRQVLVNVSSLLSELISLFATIAMLWWGFGLVALGAGPLVREVIQNLINWPALMRLIRIHGISPALTRSDTIAMARQVGWSFTGTLGNTLRRNIDALLVSQLFGNSAVVAVEWTKRAWEVLSLLLTRVSASFSPGLASVYGEGDHNKFRIVASRLVCAITIGAIVMFAGGAALNAGFVGLWVGAKFYLGTEFNLAVGISTCVAVLASTLAEILFASSVIRGPALAQVGQVCVRLVLLALLQRKIGLLSIPVSAVLAEVAFYMPYLCRQIARHVGMIWRDVAGFAMLLFRVAVSTVAASVFWVLWPIDTWGRFIAVALGGVLCGLALLAIVEPKVSHSLRGLVRMND
jgi:Polysaccharide biosynthesis protein